MAPDRIDATSSFYIDADAWQFCWELQPPVQFVQDGEPVGTDGRLRVRAFDHEGSIIEHWWLGLVEGDTGCGFVPRGGIGVLSVSAFGRGAAWLVRVEPVTGVGPSYELSERTTWEDLAALLGAPSRT